MSAATCTEALRLQYSDCMGRATRLSETMREQVGELLQQGQIPLGVPMECRVKGWDSIEEKLDRKGLSLEKIEDLDDLIGLRLILLFRSNLLAVDTLLRDTFDVVSSEDTASRLSETQFGYQSQHYVVRLPKSWLKVPSMTELGGLKIEIQVRTLAQHIWAAASHKLQYKHEESVPPPLRRAIHRVSALLETVDLEFDRVMEERHNYNADTSAKPNDSDSLNVDLLASVLRDIFPVKNMKEDEAYEALLSDLKTREVETVAQLKALLKKHYDTVIAKEQSAVKSAPINNFNGTTPERNSKGVYYSHVGLARTALREEFPHRKFCKPK